jgi:hypothetical protein
MQLAGFQTEVVKTTHAGHAKSLISTFDFSACPDGMDNLHVTTYAIQIQGRGDHFF